MSFIDLPKSSWLDLAAYIEKTLSAPRYADPRCLSRFGRKVYSQNDEDGLIAEIFRRIGTHQKTFLEFGVETGIECNSLWLLLQGWRGAWIEGDARSFAAITATHQAWLADGSLRLRKDFITAENIGSLISACDLPTEIDLLSIDIDGNDYWVWKAINTISPRVVCIEYNATWPPPARVTVDYNPASSWSRTNYFGASLGALGALGAAKGYSLVGCNLSGANAFFVRTDLCGDHFYKPGCVATHYEPARYFLAYLPSGHPAGLGKLLQV